MPTPDDDANPAPTLALWLDPGHVEPARAVVSKLGGAGRLIALSGPRGLDLPSLGDELGCPTHDDPRQMLTAHKCDALLLACAPPAPRALLQAAHDHKRRVISLEPVAIDLAAMPPSDAVRVPAFVTTSAFNAFADDQQEASDAGQPLTLQSMSLHFVGPRREGTLFARLHDAFDALLALAELPELIDASLCPASKATPRDRGPDSLPYIAGHLTGHARLPGARAATLLLSDQIESPQRRVHAVLDSRQIDMIDDLSYADLVARAITQHATWQPRPERAAEILACCHAALLSCRTGAPERPRKLLELHGHARSES